MNFEKYAYIPVLITKSAEMLALKELPERDKEKFIPAIQLRPWLVASLFDNTLKVVSDAYGKDRKWIGNIDKDYLGSSSKKIRPAVETYYSLLQSKNGYENWCTFVEENEKIIPCIQLGDIEQFDRQLERLLKLERGVVLHLDVTSYSFIEYLELLEQKYSNEEFLFIIDFKTLDTRQDLLSSFAIQETLITRIINIMPNCKVAISSTSFPNNFQGSPANSEIRERALFNIANDTIENKKLIYSDRASARIPEESKPMAKPFPRIDYPRKNDWLFFRASDKDAGYQEVAKRVIENNAFDSKLKLWGIEMIKNTVTENVFNIITSPAKATAVRINLHLHHQLFYDSDSGIYETEDDWVD